MNFTTSTFYFIANPNSGLQSTRGLAKKVSQSLTQCGRAVLYNETTSVENTTALIDHGKTMNDIIFVVAGGDGTVRSVLSQLIHCEIPLYIIPTGTENLLARAYGIGITYSAHLNILKHGGKCRTLDLIKSKNDLFIAVASVGFDAEVIKLLHKDRTTNINWFTYTKPFINQIINHKFPVLKVIADGQTVCQQRGLIFLGNINQYAMAMPFMPDAIGDNGFIEVATYKCGNRFSMFWLILLTRLRLSTLSRRIVRLKCKSVEISAATSENCAVQFDGEIGPSLPIKAEIIQGACKIVTPMPSNDQRYCSPLRFYHIRKIWSLLKA